MEAILDFWVKMMSWRKTDDRIGILVVDVPKSIFIHDFGQSDSRYFFRDGASCHFGFDPQAENDSILEGPGG